MIGKFVCNNLYIHKSAVKYLNNAYTALYKHGMLYVKNFKYEIIKMNLKDNSISFIQSHNWNTANEPDVGNSLYIRGDTIKLIKARGQIYHKKYLMVADDYIGFNVVESKQRAENIENNSKFIELKKSDKHLMCRIGYKKFWIDLLKKNKCSSVK